MRTLGRIVSPKSVFIIFHYFLLSPLHVYPDNLQWRSSFWVVSFVLVEECVYEEFLLFRWLPSINHGWWINVVDSWSRCPVSWSHLLKGVSQITHQCLSNWKQLSGECTFLSCCVPSPSRQGGIDAICMWSFSNVMSRQRWMGEVISFFPKSQFCLG